MGKQHEMNESNETKQKSRILTVLCAFLLPGAGHWYAGSYSKGLLLLAGFLLDLFTLIRLAEWNGGKHLLLIVYLGLLLPLFYYFSVFDALQSLEKEKEQTQQYALPLQGASLVLIGVGLVLLVNPGYAIRELLEAIAPWLTGLLPILLAIWLVLPTEELRSGNYRLGKYTASLAIAAIGLIGLLDFRFGKSYFSLIPTFWPYLFVALGLELVVYSIVNRQRLKLRVSLGSLLFALLTASATYFITQNSDLPERFLEQFQIQPKIASELGEAQGFHFNKPVMNVAMNENLATVKINNTNGNVVVETADIPYIQVSSQVWIDLKGEQEAKAAAEEAQVVITEGETMLIEAQSSAYGSDKRIPRVDMHIVLPLQLSNRWVDNTINDAEEHSGAEVDAEINESAGEETGAEASVKKSNEAVKEIDGSEALKPDDIVSNETADADAGQAIESTNDNTTDQYYGVDGDLANDQMIRQPERQLKIDVQNGTVTLKDLRLNKGLIVKIDSGDVEAYRISAPIQIKLNSGKIKMEQVIGDSTLETKNGIIEALDIFGQVYAKATNGSVALTRVENAIEAETKNGNIDISYAASSIKADTLNGNISVMSPLVKGDWDLDSSVGEISAALPTEGDYAVHGSVTFGTITSELPFEIVRKTIKGRSGTGDFRIQINATNSISIKALP